MPIRFNIAVAVAPALGLLWLFQRWDARRPEPAGRVRNVVLLGMAICVPAAIIELIASRLLGRSELLYGGFFKAFGVAAATEETLKLLVVMVYLWGKSEFDEVMDGILYTAAASLGFALLENVLYSAHSAILGFVRAFTAVPLHAICAGIMGYFVGRARFARSAAPVLLVVGLTIAISIHGLYDWIVFSGGGFGVMAPNQLLGLVLVMPLLAVFGVILYGLVRSARALDDARLGVRPVPAPLPQYGALYPYVPQGQPGYPAPQYAQAMSVQPAYPQQPYAPPPGYGQPGYPPQCAQPHLQPPGGAQPGAPPAQQESVSPFAATQWAIQQQPPPPKGWPPSGNAT